MNFILDLCHYHQKDNDKITGKNIFYSVYGVSTLEINPGDFIKKILKSVERKGELVLVVWLN